MGDGVILKAAPNEPPFLGVLVDLRMGTKGPLMATLQWYFRWHELPMSPDASALARRKELWFSNHTDPNPAATIVGKFEVRDATSMTKKQVLDYLAG